MSSQSLCACGLLFQLRRRPHFVWSRSNPSLRVTPSARYEVEDTMRDQAVQHEQVMKRKEQQFTDRLQQERDRQGQLEDKNLDTQCAPRL
jgi:hypothetical protein